VEVLVHKCDSDEFVMFVGIAVMIWFRRNTVVHVGEFLLPNSIAREAITLAEEYKKANLSMTIPPIGNRSGIQPKWKEPAELYYKLNWDAAVDKFNRRLGIGIVVRDHEGYVHATKSMTILGHLELVAVEVLAAFYASLFFKELDLHNIILEGDALQVVKVVSFNVRNWRRIEQLVDDTRIMLNSLSSWQILHISRIANKAVHDITQVAIKQFIDRIWMK
jgi:ribonuclease HI